MNYYIIGGGITGLTLAHCLHSKGINKNNIKIYTKDVGGQIANNVYLGPRILKKNNITEKFVKSLGIKSKPKTFKIGYLHENGEITSSYDDEEFEIYCEKTERNKQISAMSNRENEFEGWNWKDIELLNILTNKYSQCIEIKNMSVEEIKQLSYEENNLVISTINLFNKPNQNDFKKISFFEKIYPESSKFDYVYDVRKNSPIKRFNFGEKNIVEVIGDKDYIGDEYNYITTMNQIYSNNFFETEGNILLEGRFARLQHSCKLENVIERWY